jgi:hypothetical protein
MTQRVLKSWWRWTYQNFAVKRASARAIPEWVTPWEIWFGEPKANNIVSFGVDRYIERPDDLLCNWLFIMCFTRFHIKTASKWCCLRVRMVALCLHVIAITRPHPDNVVLLSRWMQSVHAISLSRILVFGQCCPDVRMGASCLPTSCLRRKARIFSNSEKRPDVLPWHLDGCKLKLFETSRHRWAFVCITRLSRRKQRIQLFWVGICTKFFWNFWNSFLEAWGIASCHNKAFSVLEKWTLNTLQILKCTASLLNNIT